jgi:hypothetical protein
MCVKHFAHVKNEKEHLFCHHCAIFCLLTQTTPIKILWRCEHYEASGNSYFSLVSWFQICRREIFRYTANIYCSSAFGRWQDCGVRKTMMEIRRFFVALLLMPYFYVTSTPFSGSWLFLGNGINPNTVNISPSAASSIADFFSEKGYTYVSLAFGDPTQSDAPEAFTTLTPALQKKEIRVAWAIGGEALGISGGFSTIGTTESNSSSFLLGSTWGSLAKTWGVDLEVDIEPAGNGCSMGSVGWGDVVGLIDFPRWQNYDAFLRGIRKSLPKGSSSKLILDVFASQGACPALVGYLGNKWVPGMLSESEFLSVLGSSEKITTSSGDRLVLWNEIPEHTVDAVNIMVYTDSETPGSFFQNWVGNYMSTSFSKWTTNHLSANVRPDLLRASGSAVQACAAKSASAQSYADAFFKLASASGIDGTMWWAADQQMSEVSYGCLPENLTPLNEL